MGCGHLCKATWKVRNSQRSWHQQPFLYPNVNQAMNCTWYEPCLCNAVLVCLHMSSAVVSSFPQLGEGLIPRAMGVLHDLIEQEHKPHAPPYTTYHAACALLFAKCVPPNCVAVGFAPCACLHLRVCFQGKSCVFVAPTGCGPSLAGGQMRRDGPRDEHFRARFLLRRRPFCLQSHGWSYCSGCPPSWGTGTAFSLPTELSYVVSACR